MSEAVYLPFEEWLAKFKAAPKGNCAVIVTISLARDQNADASDATVSLLIKDLADQSAQEVWNTLSSTCEEIGMHVASFDMSEAEKEKTILQEATSPSSMVH